MPHREHRTRDGGQGVLSKVGGSQAGGQAGVLHTDLDGDSTALGGVQLQSLAYGKAGQVAQQVVQDDDDQDQQAAGHDLGAVGGDHGADDQHDGGGGHQRQHADGLLSELVEEVVDHKAQGDGHQHHLDDGQEHTHGVHIHTLAGVQQGEQRGEQGSKYGGNGGHADGQGHIPLGQIGHDVGGGAAGAGAHQDDADGQFGGQVEHHGEHPCQEGHEGELRYAAHDDVFRAAEHHLEIIGLQGQAHAEHDDAQQVVHPAGLDHAERAGEEQGTGGHYDDDEGHVLAHKVAYFFQSFHVDSPFLFCGVNESMKHPEWPGAANKKRLCLPS